MVEYFYPYEVFKYKDVNAKKDVCLTKSYVVNLMKNGVCCSCNKTLINCECPWDDKEKQKEFNDTRNVFKMREDFWKNFDGDFKSVNDIAEYAKSVYEYQMSKLEKKQE